MSRSTSACRILATALAVGAGLAATSAAVASPRAPYEVWLTDQNNTAGFTTETVSRPIMLSVTAQVHSCPA